MKNIFVKYPPEITLNAAYEVVTWDVSISGGSGRTVSGTGPKLSQPALDLIKQARSGSTITISSKYKGAVGGFSACVIKVR
jgi:hypothetical protein